MKNKKTNFCHFLIFVFCAFVAAGLASCSSSHHNTKRPISYSRQKTKQLGWNTSTSPTTTYYIRKHSTRKRHNP